jgi:hypothetical protein
MFEPIGPPPLANRVSLLLLVWCMLLPFWLLMSLGAGGIRTKIGGHLYVISWVSYPLMLGLAFFYKRSKPFLVILPGVSFAAIFVSAEIDNLLR